jgi:hypothetical protein
MIDLRSVVSLFVYLIKKASRFLVSDELPERRMMMTSDLWHVDCFWILGFGFPSPGKKIPTTTCTS